MSDLHESGKRDRLVVLALFLLLMARACAFGVRYWPQLDDYIQYHNYPSSGSFWALQQATGLLASRPLAGLADYFIWGQMFPWMIVGVALISLMLALSAVLLRRQLGRYFTVGPLFLVIVTLLPLGVEGTYWMSASTRIVCGLLLAVLAAGAFLKWMDTGRWTWALAYVLLQPLPLGLYEQSGILAVTLVVGYGILEVIRSRKRLARAALSLWSLPAMMLYYLLMAGLFASDGVYGSRAEIILPVVPYWWGTFLWQVLGQMKQVFGAGMFYTLVKGFVRGVRLIVSGKLLLWALVVAALCVLLWRLLRREGHSNAGGGEKLSPWLAVVAGVLLFLAPISIFFVLGNPWFSFRGAVTSFVGLALLCDTAVTALWSRLPGRQHGPAVLAAAAALVFCVAGASEIGDYRDTWENDQRVAAAVLETMEEEFPVSGPAEQYSQRVGVLNVEASYLPNQNYFYHEHIPGCTESAWAFQGLLGCAGDGRPLPSVTPLPSWPVYRAWNAETSRPETFDVLYYYNGASLERVTLKPSALGEHDFLVYGESGGILGRIWEEDSNG